MSQRRRIEDRPVTVRRLSCSDWKLWGWLSIPADGQACRTPPALRESDGDASWRGALRSPTLRRGLSITVAEARVSHPGTEDQFLVTCMKVSCARPGWSVRAHREGGMRHLRRTMTDGGARVQHLHDAARQTRRRSPATAESDVGDLKETARSDPSTRSTN